MIGNNCQFEPKNRGNAKNNLYFRLKSSFFASNYWQLLAIIGDFQGILCFVLLFDDSEYRIIMFENLRFYIAFSKNIRATQFMNSVSTYLPAGLGGINGSKIENDQIIDFVEVGPKNSSYHFSDKHYDDLSTSIIRVVKGPE